MTHNFSLDELMNTLIYLLGPEDFLSVGPQRKTFVLKVAPADVLAGLSFSRHLLTLLSSGSGVDHRLCLAPGAGGLTLGRPGGGARSSVKAFPLHGRPGHMPPRCPFCEGLAAQLWVCGQQTLSSCQVRQGQPWLQRTILPQVTRLLSRPVTEQG